MVGLPKIDPMALSHTLQNLNTCPPADFVQALAGVWEHAPWVAQAVVGQRPFASVEDLHGAMVRVVAGWPEPKRVAFYAGHPELAGLDARRGTMTDASVAEQAALALGALDGAEARLWDGLNRTYRDRFGFPFILCVRRHNRASALLAFQQRLGHDRATELALALDEIAAITRLRLEHLLSNPVSPNPPVVL